MGRLVSSSGVGSDERRRHVSATVCVDSCRMISVDRLLRWGTRILQGDEVGEVQQEVARDYYGMLGVGRGASDSEIKRAYRTLARTLHPDVNPDESAQARFKDISAAYEVLSDPQKRRIVDMGGDPLDTAAAAGGGFAGFGGFADVVEDLLGRAFGGNGSSPQTGAGRVRPGSDSLVRVDLNLDECATGTTKQVNVDTAVLCDQCQGKGGNNNCAPTPCGSCGGRGQVHTVARSVLGMVKTAQPCPGCHGAGEIIADPCRRCSGQGRVRARREVSVQIPAGVAGGTRVRLGAHGEVGPGGGPAGDLYVEVNEHDHHIFVRDGADLHCTVAVPMIDAALGTSIKLDAIIDGCVEITIAAGTQPGQVITMRGHGIPHLRTGVRGDLHVHIDVVIPTTLNQHEKQLLHQLKNRNPTSTTKIIPTTPTPTHFTRTTTTATV